MSSDNWQRTLMPNHALQTASTSAAITSCLSAATKKTEPPIDESFLLSLAAASTLAPHPSLPAPRLLAATQ